MRQRGTFRFALVFAVLALVVGGPLPAQESELRGPLRIRDLMPPSILGLGAVPLPAVSLAPGRWGVEVHYSDANICIMNDEVGRYLEHRGAKGPLTAADVAALCAGAGGDAFYFDGEIGMLNLGVHRALRPGLDAYLMVPVYLFTGGSLDSMIEGFHRAFGLGQAGRDKMARNEFQVLMRLGDDHFAFLRAPSRGGLGDPTVGFRYTPPGQGNTWQGTIEAASKIPAARADRFLSCRHADYGLQFGLQRVAGRSRLGHTDERYAKM